MTFKALLADKAGETISTSVVEMDERDLMPGDVSIAVASTGRPEEADYPRELGAAEVIDRHTLSEPGAPLGAVKWAGATDSVGITRWRTCLPTPCIAA